MTAPTIRERLGCLTACILGLALVLITPRVAHTQLEGQIIKVKGDTITVSLIPSVVLDERYLALTPHYTAEFPERAWVEARECFLKLPGVKRDGAARYYTKPTLLVIPMAAAMIVRDNTINGILQRADSTADVHWSNPAFAYALLSSRAVAIVERYKNDHEMLRHEALHFWTWWYFREMGHPTRVFDPCDRLFK